MNARQHATHTWLVQPILPVVVIDSVDQGLQIAEGLLQGGISQIEITLRTPAALPAMQAIARAFPEMKLSAGTVLRAEQFDQCAEAGATLFISPGLTEVLAQHALDGHFNWVPGTATASEMMRALELGFDLVKFFPAMAAGGPKALEGIATPLSGVRVVPTGGITLANLKDWKPIRALAAVGGTWLTQGLGQVACIRDEVAARSAAALNAWNDA